MSGEVGPFDPQISKRAPFGINYAFGFILDDLGRTFLT